jgi:hypothetical protein
MNKRGVKARRVVRAVAAVGLVVCLGGCAAFPPAQAGQTVGTIIGSAIAPGVGAPLGALVGLVAGMFVQHEVDQVVERKERVELGRQLAHRPLPSGSSSTAPQMVGVGRVWVDETFRNGKLIPGHFEER